VFVLECSLVFNLLAGFAVLGFTLLALAMVGQNLSTPQAVDWKATILILLGVSQIIETPIILCLCLPRKTKVDYINL